MKSRAEFEGQTHFNHVQFRQRPQQNKGINWPGFLGTIATGTRRQDVPRNRLPALADRLNMIPSRGGSRAVRTLSASFFQEVFPENWIDWANPSMVGRGMGNSPEAESGITVVSLSIIFILVGTAEASVNVPDRKPQLAGPAPRKAFGTFGDSIRFPGIDSRNNSARMTTGGKPIPTGTVDTKF